MPLIDQAPKRSIMWGLDLWKHPLIRDLKINLEYGVVVPFNMINFST